MRLKQTVLVLLIFAGTFANYGQNFKFGKVSKEEIAEKQHPSDPDADAAILYRSMKTHFDYDEDLGFYLMTEVHERIKLYEKEGFDWATHEISLYQSSGTTEEEVTGLKGYTYIMGDNGKVEEIKLKSSGIFDEDRSKYRSVKKFTMPGIKAGCVIEYKYQIKSPFVSNIDEYQFQETIPVNKVVMEFKSPEYYNYRKHSRGWIPLKLDESTRERTMRYRYTRSSLQTGSVIGNTSTEEIKFREMITKVDMENIPGLVLEPHAGNLSNYTSSLKFELEYSKFPNQPIEMYTSNWDAVSEKIYRSESFGKQLDRTGYFEADLDAALSGVTSSGEKLVTVFEFVKSRMNWNKYIGYYCDEGVKAAYKNRVGNVADINLMLVAMLQHAGLDANPVLISTKSNGIPLFPTRNGFNYVIAGVALNEGMVLLDATDKMGAPNILNDRLLNWEGRLIRKDGSSSWIPLSPAKPATFAYMIKVDVSEDGGVSGLSKSQYGGHQAREYRAELMNESGNDVDFFLAEHFEGISTSNSKVENRDNPYQPLKIDYEFESSDYAETIGGDLFVSPLVFVTMDESPFKLEDRKYPIDYGYARKGRYIITVNVPEGYTVSSLPESVNYKMSNNMLSFKYLISQQGQAIQIMSEMGINVPSIPADQYQEIKKFFQAVIEKNKEKIVLSKI